MYATMARETKRRIEAGLIPRYLHKYRAIDKKAADPKRTEEIITTNSIFFALPKDLNDPFECKAIIDVSATPEEIEGFFRRNSPGMGEEQLAKFVARFVKDPALFESTLQTSYDDLVPKTGLCCLGEKADNILMWAHYADSHKGICLKFDLLEAYETFAFIGKVNYTNEYPKYNVLSTADKFKSYYCTKARCWEYEDEWRAIRPTGPELIHFPKKALVEIVFGCNTKPEDIQRIQEVVAESGGYDIKYQQAHTSPDNFSLVISPLAA